MRMLMALGLLLGWSLVFRTDTDRAYRTASPHSSECKSVSANILSVPGIDNDETKVSPKGLDCYYQSHVNGQAGYDLAFMEFGDDGKLLLAAQKDEFLRRIAGQKVFLVVFIHGWRNDARPGNENLRHFRTLLSYSDMYRQERCAKTTPGEQRYCGHRTVGLYIGWRGAVIDESGVLGWTALASIWNRKAVSEGALSAAVVSELREIGARLRRQSEARAALAATAAPPAPAVLPATDPVLSLAAPGSAIGQMDTPTRPIPGPPGTFEHSKMIVVGHSLGGNLLISAFGEEYLRRIREVGKHNLVHTASSRDKQLLEAPIGDLVVLLNPAAEAAKWTSMQRLVRSLAQLQDHQDGNEHSYKIFADRQRPVMVSYTAVCDWGKLTEPDARECGRELTQADISKLNCDQATATAFRAAKYAGLNFNAESTTALGHLVPAADPKTGIGQRVGATHEVEIDLSLKQATSYKDGGVPRWSGCAISDGWYHRRYIEEVEPAYDKKFKLSIDPPAVVQLRRGVYRGCFSSKQAPGCKNGNCRSVHPTATQTRDPFWNIRVHNNVIPDHNRVFAHLFWCSTNQLVLDRIID